MFAEKPLSGKIISFGELLLRISPDAAGDWLTDNSIPIYVGGAELNVATALALWEIPSAYLTALPENDLSRQIAESLEKQGLDLSATIYGGSRIGIYFLTRGQDLKNNALIYDRAGSAFTELKPDSIDWNQVFKGVSMFHFTAICPAISQELADICLEAVKAAAERNILVSIDLNYRSKLWKYGKEPLDIMPGLAAYAGIIMGNIWAAELMLGIPVAGDLHSIGTREAYLKEAEKSSALISAAFPRCHIIAHTFRLEKGDELNYYTALYTGGKSYTSSHYSTPDKLNKVGSGDCFMAGLLYGIYKGWDPSRTLEFATAAAFEKLFIAGDAINLGVEEILEKSASRMLE